MLQADFRDDGTLALVGRFDAAHVATAEAAFDQITTSTSVDFSGLDYISSAGLGVLLYTQKRLNEKGHQIRLRGLRPHIATVFQYAGFHLIFEME